MRDLTRAEQETLIELLGVVIDNGRGSLAGGALPPASAAMVLSLVHCARQVRDACRQDLVNQVG